MSKKMITAVFCSLVVAASGIVLAGCGSNDNTAQEPSSTVSVVSSESVSEAASSEESSSEAEKSNEPTESFEDYSSVVTAEPSQATNEVIQEEDAPIVGTWHAVSQEDYGSGVVNDNRPNLDIYLTFDKDGSAYDQNGEISFKYQLQENGRIAVSQYTTSTRMRYITLVYENDHIYLITRLNGGNATIVFDKV